MYFKQVQDEHNGCASYVIGSQESHEAAIVDPSANLEQYETILRERGLRLRYVIDTHVHADHVSLARALATRHNGELCLHEAAEVTYPHRSLHDGEELPLGEVRLRVLHTPGHRRELISLLVINTARSPEPEMVLTADSLLAADVGRPDFGGGDASAQYASMQKLLGLPDWVGVFPGHFEGPCGANMEGRPNTTIGFERRYNPLLQLERDTFVGQLEASVPARPLNMVAIEATNRGREEMDWAMPRGTETVPDVDVAALEHRLENALLLDVREPSEYTSGHVPGARNIPQAELASRLAELPRDQEMYVICRSGSRSHHSAQFLKQLGFERVTNVGGGTQAWKTSGRPLEKGGAHEAARATKDVRASQSSQGEGKH
jgi:hydroxyacylglutathione hydrolase